MNSGTAVSLVRRASPRQVTKQQSQSETPKSWDIKVIVIVRELKGVQVIMQYHIAAKRTGPMSKIATLSMFLGRNTGETAPVLGNVYTGSLTKYVFLAHTDMHAYSDTHGHTCALFTPVLWSNSVLPFKPFYCGVSCNPLILIPSLFLGPLPTYVRYVLTLSTLLNMQILEVLSDRWNNTLMGAQKELMSRWEEVRLTKVKICFWPTSKNVCAVWSPHPEQELSKFPSVQNACLSLWLVRLLVFLMKQTLRVALQFNLTQRGCESMGKLWSIKPTPK